jgi:arylsulfatase A-like enzyme
MSRYFYQRNKNDPKKIAYIRALYDENILLLDKQLKGILASLKPQLDKDTILIITADHGEEFMEHRDLGHSSLYNEVLRVPLIVSVPKVPARMVTAPAEGIDLYPTVLRFLGIAPASPIEGSDLTGSILGLPFSHGKPYIISDLYYLTSPENTDILYKQKTIVTDKWKLYAKNIDNLTNPKNIELYDAKNDPRDTTNVSSQYPKIVHALTSQLQQYMQTHSVIYPKPPDNNHSIPNQNLQDQRYFHY